MSKVPEEIKPQTVTLVSSDDIPLEDQELFFKWSSMAYMGPQIEVNRMLFWHYEFVEQFYTVFLPFYNELKKGGTGDAQQPQG